MSNSSNMALRIVLALTGAAIVWTGLNVGLGGIHTLGWQGPADFLAVTNASAFGAQDSHVRFLGGVWLGVGLMLIAGAVMLERLRPVLVALTALVFVGGLARFSVPDAATVVTSPAVMPSLIAELVLFPALGFWILWSRQHGGKHQPHG